MAWIYLAESEGSRLLYQSGLGQSPTVNEIDMLSPFCSQECKKGNCPSRQSGMMCEALPHYIFPTNPMLSSAAFHVRTSVLLAMEQAWLESEADFSSKSVAWSKKSSPLSSSWKTCQPLELEVFEKSSEHLQIWGMTVDGLVSLPKKLEPTTSEKDGFFLPTPTAQSYGSNQGGGAGRVGKKRYSLEALWKAGRLPTPTVSQKSYDRQRDGSITHSLSGLWRATTGTTMPPTFSEWVMGYPIGWTALEDWATQWFLSKRKQRSKNYSDLHKGA